MQSWTNFDGGHRQIMPMADDILRAIGIGEEVDWEFKSARGGLPGSLWETYSAMANTDGGVIVLGVEQRDEQFSISGLPDPGRMQKNFWDTVNNRGKISVNLLRNDDATIETIDDKKVLAIRVPRAVRRDRPVYVGQNPLRGTYRRNFEGDYKCSEDEVGRMLADRSEEPADSHILEGFTVDDLNRDSLQRYRQRFSARVPDHPWLTLEEMPFLKKLGAWRRDRAANLEGLTVAGLLMFGEDDAIRDAGTIPQYQVDYRERYSDDPHVRWTDRVTVDGTWCANLFEFYERVIPKLTAEIKIPFRLEPDLLRRDDTPVHEAIREALVNAMIHADYRGQGGIVIDKYRDRIEISNPGCLLISYEQLLAGGVSECRNRSLQTMFHMIGRGEKAGSGFDKIRTGWKSQHWLPPSLQETVHPDRVRLTLRTVSLLPEESIERLKGRFGSQWGRLSAEEIQALVIADVEGSVANARLRSLSDQHSADLSRMLQKLVGKGLLEQVRQKRWAFYRLPSHMESSEGGAGHSPHSGDDSPHNEKDSPHSGGSSPQSGSESPGTEQESLRLSSIPRPESEPSLQAIAAPAQNKKRLAPERMRQLILQLCAGRYLSVQELAALLHRDPKGLQERYLTPMCREGLLMMRYPDRPNRPDQAYSIPAPLSD